MKKLLIIMILAPLWGGAQSIYGLAPTTPVNSGVAVSVMPWRHSAPPPIRTVMERPSVFRAGESALGVTDAGISFELTYKSANDVFIIDYDVYGKTIMTHQTGEKDHKYVHLKRGSDHIDEEGYWQTWWKARNNETGEKVFIKIRRVGERFEHPYQIYIIHKDNSYILYNCIRL